MKRVHGVLLGLVLMSLTLGCSKDDNKKAEPSVPQQEAEHKALDLSNKSLNEVLQIKYAKAELKCEAWAQFGEKLDLTRAPNKSVSLDLKQENLNFPQTLKLAFATDSHKAEILIEISSMQLSQGTTAYEGDQIYSLKYTPYVTSHLTYKAVTTYPSGPFIEKGDYPQFMVNEKIKRVIVNSTVQPAHARGDTAVEPVFFRSYAHCFIDTEIRSEYQDQYTVERFH